MTARVNGLDVEKLYDFITGEDDEGRVCEEIPEDACTDVPRNFFLNVLNGSATKLGDQLGSPSLVLPWFLDALGAPTFLAGLLVPVRRSLALLPQLAIAGRIRRFEKRKWFWAGGAFGFGLAFLLMVPTALIPSSTVAGFAVVLLLALASLARGISSVAFKDVLAKTVPKGRRGRLLAMRATVGGFLTLVAGVLLRLYVADGSTTRPFLVLLSITAGLWFIGAILVLAIREKEGTTAGGRNALEEASAGLRLVRAKPGFRTFIIARALLLSVQLAGPFYALYARRLTGGHISGLGLFVIAVGLAEVLSSPLWGRFSDRSSRTVMMLGASLAVVVGVAILVVGALPETWQTASLLAPVFLLAGFAQAGVRLGRKTYLVDGAPELERPLYVAFSNTIIGALTLAGSVLGLLAEAFSLRLLLIVLVVLMALGALVCWRMPEAEKMTAV
jgi:Na+/melibiose symporter-like transporter